MKLLLRDVSCWIGGKSIFSRLNCSLAAGERVALVGPNGVGKTTLFRCLLGIAPYSGSIELNGVELSKVRPVQRALHISYVPQRLEVAFRYRVKDFLQMAAYARLQTGAVTRQQIMEHIEQTAARTGAADFLHSDLQSISMGERQRVLLAAALIQQADVILLDEPTAYLDPRGVEQFFSVMADLPPELSILLATHELNYVSELCQRVLGLHAGTIAFDGAVSEFLTAEMLERIYGTSPRVVRIPHRELPVVLPQVSLR